MTKYLNENHANNYLFCNPTASDGLIRPDLDQVMDYPFPNADFIQTEIEAITKQMITAPPSLD